MTAAGRRSRGAVVLLAGAGVVALVGPAAGSTDSGFAMRPQSSEREALALLRQASRAARVQPYSGTQFVSSWTADGGTSVLVSVSHLPGRGLLVRVEPTVESPGGRHFGPDELSDGGLLGEEPADAGDLSVSTFQGRALSLLAEHYDVSLAESGSCAGRAAQVVDVRRTAEQGAGLAGRFWVDRTSGLVLRREVFDTGGRMLRASAFIDLDLDVPVETADDGAARMAAAAPPTDRLDLDALESMRSEGWAVPQTLPGELELYDARSREQDGTRVLHLSYSDGLSTVSLFAQRGRLDTDSLGGWSRDRIGEAEVWVGRAVPQRLVWSGGDKVYTLVADAPSETVDAAVRSLPHAQQSDGVLARLGRGLGRVGSWANPFS